MTTVLVVLVVLSLTKAVISQSNTSVNYPDIPNHCRVSEPRLNFYKNRNSTLDELRMQLLSKRVLYARAHNSSGGDPVFAEAQCRNYLTVDRCVDCFDAAVFNLVKCIDGDGATVFLDDCSTDDTKITNILRSFFVRYEAFSQFYNNPNVNEDLDGTGGFSICGNVSQSQPLSSYSQTVDDFLSDIRDATPKTSNSYVASIKQIADEKATVYAIAQCTENINQAICQGCMNTAYNKLKECLPNTEVKYFDNACFANYSETPIFNDNQTIDITNILKGWSSEDSDLYLVLEYMANGSLDQFLWGAKKGTLDWNQRYEIILGIAKGLAHLHTECHVKIIHRDIKSSNILLSDDSKAKIADFGLARFQPEDETHVNTKFAGTLGYAAPEYVLRGALSDKVDTNSFGIVVLEIISSRRFTDINSDRPSMEYLLEHAWKLYEKKMHRTLIDETLDLNQYQKITEIALLCTQSPPSNRPTMSEVVLMLQEDQSFGKRQLTRPTFIHNQDRRIQIVGS